MQTIEACVLGWNQSFLLEGVGFPKRWVWKFPRVDLCWMVSIGPSRSTFHSPPPYCAPKGWPLWTGSGGFLAVQLPAGPTSESIWQEVKRVKLRYSPTWLSPWVAGYILVPEATTPVGGSLLTALSLHSSHFSLPWSRRCGNGSFSVVSPRMLQNPLLLSVAPAYSFSNSPFIKDYLPNYACWGYH